MPTFEDMIIAALPWGMRDSWRNPHPLLEEGERPYYRGVVKTFSKDELETMCEDFEALVPAIPVGPAGMPAAQHMAIITQWHQDLAAVPMRREAFFKQHTANANMIMEKALIIDKAVRAKARKDREIKKKNRESRAQFFKDCAEIDLPDVPAECVKISRPFLAAIKIGTDGGTPRSWAILKPKIRKEWNTLYEEGMKEVMWDHDKIQKEQKRMRELAIQEASAVNEKSLVEEEMSNFEDESMEEAPVEEERVEGDWGEPGQDEGDEGDEEDEEDEEDEGTEPYSIWKDRDLACEFYKYSSSRAGKKRSTADNGSNGSAIESLCSGERVGTGNGFSTGDGHGTDNGFNTDDVSGNDNASRS